MEESLPSLDPSQKRKDPKLFVILGWIFAVITLFFLPFLFGPAAIIMGAIAIKRGAKANGIWIIVLAALVLLLYLVLTVFAVSFLMNLPTAP
ncbi:hypothetical protein CIG75_17150 [Tumebacillus algifaecis]|uniref:DUF4190 domain-containing protein n=1 Tax=Tumebacillus algifaecis TaxID=1214604 RepID=A0A223D501_9BACL|nr:hypothetical protein [Tumebacillus algifaecis]ASS76513.1 hypothetical protein CIG75_17150 [Tumebacillus algifaecis]